MTPTWLSFFLTLLLAAMIGCRPSPPSAAPTSAVVDAMNRGVSLMGQYRYEDAVKAFEAVLFDAPNLDEARVNLAIARFNRNRPDDIEAGEALLQTVLQRDPDNARALYFLAIVRQHAGLAGEAIPLLEKVLTRHPEDGAAWYLLALCQLRAGQPAEAGFLKAIEYRPYLFSAYYQLFQLAMRAGHDAAAQPYLDRFKALRESPLGESLEFPQYNQMGDLALAHPLPATRPPPIARSRFVPRPARLLGSFPGPNPPPDAPESGDRSVLAAGDLNGDGLIDLILVPAPPGKPLLLFQQPEGGFADATLVSGIDDVPDAVACAVGDFDNDERADLCFTAPSGIRLFRSVDGRFVDVTHQAGISRGGGPFRSAVFLDADHDGDLDIFVCGEAVNQLWNNNGDGTFADIAAIAGVEGKGLGAVHVVAADLDRDRDLDLVVLRENGPAQVFLNQLLGRYRSAMPSGADIRGESGAALADMNGDGLPDLVALGGDPLRLQLWTGNGRGDFDPMDGMTDVSRTVHSRGIPRGFRCVDIDLDGDLDVVTFGPGLHVLLNDGRGRFVVQTPIPQLSTSALASIDALDITGDLVPDLIGLELGESIRPLVYAGTLEPPSTALALIPSGVRSRDGRTRSPASGYGVRLTVRTGLIEQHLLVSGQSGGRNQSQVPTTVGLGGSSRADFIKFTWPDGVAQVETSLGAGQAHRVTELERKISSCPVLFAWDGDRFSFVTDFAGVGGLGYFSAPGVPAPPQVLEHVKIEPRQLRARQGAYELRVTEPMEESAYLDRLELVAIDHLADVSVFPDERLAIGGPLPTHDLFVVEHRIFPIQAIDPAGRDCTEAIARVDRLYAYDPPLDRRYIGFCRPHTLELDFGDRLRALDVAAPLVLFIHGFIEYPYSQTVYAASQSRIGWEPIRIDAEAGDGLWRTVVPDAGVPGGMARTMTVDVTAALPAGTRRLRLSTNLEVHYDQVFLSPVADRGRVTVRHIPLKSAELRYVGFAREFSPDGRLPLIYDYRLTETSAPFHAPKGAYTRYGPVDPLVAEFDDRFVRMGPGDELILRFDAASVPLTPPGHERSFILVSHAYCKDMDLYTATPTTLDPLPFRAMSQYPYPEGERYPDTEAHRADLRTYHTRLIE